MIERIEKILTKVKSLVEENQTLKAHIANQDRMYRDIENQSANKIMKLQQEINASDNALKILREKLDEVLIEKAKLETTLNFYTSAPDINMTKPQIKEKIENYITQIDQCIQLLDRK